MTRIGMEMWRAEPGLVPSVVLTVSTHLPFLPCLRSLSESFVDAGGQC